MAPLVLSVARAEFAMNDIKNGAAWDSVLALTWDPSAKAKAYHTSKKQTYETPDAVITALAGWGFPLLLDICATKDTSKHEEYVGPDHQNPKLRDAFELQWHKAGSGFETGWIWQNPPYKTIDPWVGKACVESLLGAHIIGLYPARVDRPWFHGALEHGVMCLFFRHRLRFDGNTKDAPFPSVLMMFAPHLVGRTEFGLIDLKKMQLKMYGPQQGEPTGGAF